VLPILKTGNSNPETTSRVTAAMTRSIAAGKSVIECDIDAKTPVPNMMPATQHHACAVIGRCELKISANNAYHAIKFSSEYIVTAAAGRPKASPHASADIKMRRPRYSGLSPIVRKCGSLRVGSIAICA